MASSLPPVKGSAFTFDVSLVSQADTDVFKTSCTLAAGDIQVSKDGGAFANITTLPTEIGTSGVLPVALSATEMNADRVTVRFHDAAGDEWQDALVTIYTAAQTLDTTDGVADAVKAKTDNLPASPAAVGSAMTLADDAITAAKYDESTAFPLKSADTGATAVARTGADGDTLETLSDQIDGIDVNGTAAAVWAYTPRTLTQTAAAVASVMAGTSLTITRGDTLSATLTGLGNITGYANLWFTVKWATSDLDAAAIIQIDTDTGLLTVNGAAATAGNGSITVDDATAGDITIALEASVTDDLTPATGLVYDVQWQSGTSIYTLTSGVAVVSADVTRAVA